MATGLRQVLEHLQAGEGLSDGQLLTRFIASRDEASFTTLVRRHGPMVLGVCRRVLRDFHDAEDAFQATFLVLARKAPSVLRRESVGSWLYGTAYRTALEANATIARRRCRERGMHNVPHPEVAPAEAQDWRPVLDRELNLLPEKYRSAIVLCDLEGRTRREASRQLGVTEGTLSSRLARGRALLAKRLTKCGVALSGSALAATLGQEAVSAQLVNLTARAAAGQMAAASTSAVLLMKEVMKAMFLKKLRVVVGTVMVLMALGAVGVSYQAGGGPGLAQAAPPDKPLSELEALRRENELLKLNLEVVLEKVRAQEAELRAVRGKGEATKATTGEERFYPGVGKARLLTDAEGNSFLLTESGNRISVKVEKNTASDPVQAIEVALKALREAKDKEGQRRATEELEKALEKLKQQTKTEPAPKKH
jgi:RNA polymerase sigma factor (sigma-70 family)